MNAEPSRELALQLETPACDLCGGTETKFLYNVRDRRHHYPGEFKMVECTQCSLRYVSPRPVRATIANWYPTTYKAYKKKSALARTADWVEDHVWNAYLRVFLTGSYPTFYFPRHERDFATADRAPRILDIGCGSGDKLRYIRGKSTWDTFGVDFSPQAVENANANGAGDVRLSRGDELPFDDEFFDAVMSWHSLEHHYSPRATMREVARVLRPGGKAIIAIPSGNNLGIRAFRSYWGPLEVPRHLYYFTRATLARLVGEVGLEMTRVVYDFSFYGLFLDQEIFESIEFLAEDKLGPVSGIVRYPMKVLRFGGLISSAATLPILPLNWLLGRLWKGSNMIVHLSKPNRALPA
jgi:SAM-dependent methyltransferase